MVHHSLCVATQNSTFLKVMDKKILIYVVCRLHSGMTESVMARPLQIAKYHCCYSKRIKCWSMLCYMSSSFFFLIKKPKQNKSKKKRNSGIKLAFRLFWDSHIILKLKGWKALEIIVCDSIIQAAVPEGKHILPCTRVVPEIKSHSEKLVISETLLLDAVKITFFTRNQWNEEIEHLSAYIHHSMFNLQDK